MALKELFLLRASPGLSGALGNPMGWSSSNEARDCEAEDSRNFFIW